MGDFEWLLCFFNSTSQGLDVSQTILNRLLSSPNPSFASSAHSSYELKKIASQDSSNTTASNPTIYQGSYDYKYHGCYNETTQIQDSAEDRALADGTHLVKAGKMTVPMCLDFCTSNGTQYKYAGLEWSRECWCSPYLSSLSAKLSDDDCENPCEGNSSQICGGPLRLSVYQLSEGDASNRGQCYRYQEPYSVSQSWRYHCCHCNVLKRSCLGTMKKLC
ncbi:hypothetical protein FCULG_00003719 [Fusarium culmorum]|uniref:WSC domain-containing protein n=1 Tax=Fusarium culmorum TaxID=5516 RepID=A0A2T4HCG6_FUSCU|nr:hypothetical protein FCULG_00003719 [Fusarium culmorum]